MRTALQDDGQRVGVVLLARHRRRAGQADRPCRCGSDPIFDLRGRCHEAALRIARLSDVAVAYSTVRDVLFDRLVRDRRGR